MTAADITPIFREALAAHLILMAAGVPARDIFVTLSVKSPSGEGNHLAVVVVQGDFQFAVTVGRCDMAEDAFRAAWSPVVAAFKKFTNEEAREVRDSAHVRDCAVDIIAALLHKRTLHKREEEKS